MKKLSEEDLKDVFLCVIRPSKKQREHLPLVRRHYRSVMNVCRNNIEYEIDIYFSGILIAGKPKDNTKIIMSREFQRKFPEQKQNWELRA